MFFLSYFRFAIIDSKDDVIVGEDDIGARTWLKYQLLNACNFKVKVISSTMLKELTIGEQESQKLRSSLVHRKLFSEE